MSSLFTISIVARIEHFLTSGICGLEQVTGVMGSSVTSDITDGSRALPCMFVTA